MTHEILVSRGTPGAKAPESDPLTASRLVFAEMVETVEYDLRSSANYTLDRLNVTVSRKA